jgi:hypothetical protein
VKYCRSEVFNNVYSVPRMISVVKSRWAKWVVHVERIVEVKN